MAGVPRKYLQTCLLLVCGLMSLASVSADWTSKCPSKCSCKWASGKKSADCTNAGFSTVPNTLSSEIQVLDLTGNPLNVLPADAFNSVGLENLQKVYLRNCSLESVHKDAFQNLTLLIEIDLSRNLLTQLDPQTFNGNEKLRILILSHNPLGKLVDSQFPRLPHLRTLELEGAALESIDKDSFINLKNEALVSLKLSSNKLSTLKTEVLAPLGKLTSLDLQRNPWNCDCRILPLRQYLMDNNLYSAYSSTTVCAEPESLSGRSWNTLNPDDFACRPTTDVTESLVESRPGFDVTFACRVSGSPAPSVSWVLQSRQVVNVTHNSNSDQFFIREAPLAPHSSDGQNERWSNLTLRRITDQDAGEYRCVARNKGGISQVNVTLHLPLAPTVVLLDEESGISPEVVIGIAAAITAILLLGLVLLTVFLCRRHKQHRSQGHNGTSKHGGNAAVNVKDPEQEKSLLGRELDDVSQSVRTADGYEAVPQTELDKEHHVRGSCTYIPGEKYDDRLAEMNCSVPGIRRSIQETTLSPASSSAAAAGHFFPDLLNIPHHGRDGSPSLASDTSRLTMTLNPAHLAGHPNYATPDYRTLGLPYHKPIHYTDSIGSARSAVVVPAGNRPGYVTLPRRPRPRVPSWASTPVASPSPSGDRQQPLYDTIGPRITADGSSTSALSLNKIAGLTPTPSSGSNPATLANSTPVRTQKISLPAYYVPIQEVDIPPPSPLIQRGGRSSALPRSTPNILEADKSDISHEFSPSVLFSPRSEDKNSPAATSTPNSSASHTSPEVTSPVADFRLPGNRASIASVGSTSSRTSNAMGTKKKVPPAVAPKPLRPSSALIPAQRASIAEVAENNNEVTTTNSPGKVPPKPPPKPKKLSTASEEDTLSSVNENEALYEDEGEDGTEV